MTTTEDNRPLMVSIRCITYNHERFIRHCLEGFVMQKTNFRFEAIVHDDASTDGTAEIIREYAERYPDIIKPIYEKENLYSKADGSLGRVMDAACVGKYIATCEGDDYWTDPLKLQKQVDILESHPEYGAVYTDFEMFDDETGKVVPHRFMPQSGWCFEPMILEKLDIWTLTTCSRRQFWTERPRLPYKGEIHQGDRFQGDIFQGDIFVFLYITSHSQVYCLNEKTARYRILRNSASHITDPAKARYHRYTVANTHKFFLENGPKISRSAYRKVSAIMGGSRVKYAIDKNRLDIIKDTKFPFSFVRTPKQLAIALCLVMLKYKFTLTIAHKLFHI